MAFKSRSAGIFRNFAAIAAVGLTTAVVDTSARADPVTMTLTAAGDNLFSLSTFADGFPIEGSATTGIGPLGIAFTSSGSVMVADYPGNVRVFASDANNQQASAGVIGQFYGFNGSIGLANSGGNIYMMDRQSNQLVQLNNNGTLNHVVANVSFGTGVVTNPSSGHLLVSTGNGIVDVDPKTGITTQLVNNNIGGDGVAVNATGTVVYMASYNNHVLGFDTKTGAQVFDSGQLAVFPDGVAVGATGALAGQLIVNMNNGSVLDINTTTLAQTIIATGGTRGDFVAIDPSNGTLLLDQSDDIVRLTPLNGGFEGVPGPVAGAGLPGLILAGGGLLGWWRRKRKAEAAA